MYNIIITDDHPVVRNGVKQLLSNSFEIATIDEAQNGEELLHKLSKNKYDIVILDISLPGRNGLDILQDIKKINENQAVLILSAYPLEQYALRALKLGAKGYLTKAAISNEIKDAVLKIASGGKYISSELAEKIADSLNNNDNILPHEKLSIRELEVMIMISEGKSLKDIAGILNLSPKTVSTYRERILEKLRLDNTAQIIRYAIRNQLVE